MDGQVGRTVLAATNDTSLLVSGIDDVERWGDMQLARGPEYFKLAAETPGLDQATLDAIVHFARSNEKKTVCHAATKGAQEMACLAGVDQIHHSPLDRPVDVDMAAHILAKGQVVIPTLTMMKAFATLLGFNYNASRESVGIYSEAGVPILVGTDANTQVAGGVPFGTSYIQEMSLLVEAGMSPLEVLRSATVLPARHWGLDDRGVIMAGKRADLVLLSGGFNPVEDISAVGNISKVWVGGVQSGLLEVV
jgi:imidazolonepropionase-like amidohydrolase